MSILVKGNNSERAEIVIWLVKPCCTGAPFNLTHIRNNFRRS